MSKKRATIKHAETGKRLQALHLLRTAVDTTSANSSVPKGIRKDLKSLAGKLAKAEQKAGKRHRKAQRKAGLDKVAGAAGRRARKRARR